MTRPLFAARAALVALFSPLSIALLPEIAWSQDNVLIVIADDLGTDYVGVYAEGSSPAPTPNIDGLASRGVLFRNAWANPSCSPTRAGLQTGRHGYRTGIGSPGGVLLRDETTVPEALDLAGSGYSHGYIGKWHLAGGGGNPNHPNRRGGWSHFAGLIGGGVGDYYQWSRTVNGTSATSTTYTTTQIVNDALAWIATQTGPWICVVAFNAPHTPFHAPPANLHSQNLTGNPNQNPVPHYRAAVEAMDTEIGRLLANLGPDLAQTNVVFLGDNGTPARASVAPFTSSHAKGSPYEGGVGVPFIVAGPSVQAPGREVDALIHTVDLFATIGELAGAHVAVPVVRQDSVSFAPYLQDPAQLSLRPSIYSESFDTDPDTEGFAVARNQQYKLIRRFDPNGVASEEFYDLSATPFETVDLLPALSTAEQKAYDELDAHIRSVRDQEGRFETIGGASCAGSNGIPQIGGVGVPAIDSSYFATLAQAPPMGATLLTIGYSATYDSRLGAALPYDLGAVGASNGCRLYTSLERLVFFPTNAAGAAAAQVYIPDLPILLAGSFYHSWIVFDDPTPSNPSGITVTAGLRVVVGQ